MALTLSCMSRRPVGKPKWYAYSSGTTPMCTPEAPRTGRRCTGHREMDIGASSSSSSNNRRRRGIIHLPQVTTPPCVSRQGMVISRSCGYCSRTVRMSTPGEKVAGPRSRWPNRADMLKLRSCCHNMLRERICGRSGKHKIAPYTRAGGDTNHATDPRVTLRHAFLYPW
jgi:hypothetical protein